MFADPFQKLITLAAEPESMEQTVCFLAGHLRTFLKRQETILICFPYRSADSIGALLERAALQIECKPVFWGPDMRWKGLLRQVFSSRATAIAGPPLIILGLTKLAKAMKTPLKIRNVILAGYPSPDWMIEGIQRGLDCTIHGLFCLGMEAVVSGFSCGKSKGVHIREDIYSFETVDCHGEPLPEGMIGNVVITNRKDPSSRCVTVDRARLDSTVCTCGCGAPRLMDFSPGGNVDFSLISLGETLHSWTSILDCSVKRGDYGLEIEIITFPGEKIPKLPSCARRVVRPWDPETDEPFQWIPEWLDGAFYPENH